MLLAGAAAQSSDILGSLPPPGSLTTALYFPEHAQKQFPAGDVITAVISAHNDNSKAYNLTAVVASLHSPTDYSMYVQNFTHMVYFKEVQPNQERSVEYKFRLSPQVPTRDFIVAVHILYQDAAGGYFSNVAFNGTVDVVEKPSLIDWGAIFMYIMIFGTLGGIGYAVISNSSDRLGIKRVAKKARKGGDKAAAFDEDEWVKGTPYDVEKRKKAAAKAGKQS